MREQNSEHLKDKISDASNHLLENSVHLGESHSSDILYNLVHSHIYYLYSPSYNFASSIIHGENVISATAKTITKTLVGYLSKSFISYVSWGIGMLSGYGASIVSGVLSTAIIYVFKDNIDRLIAPYIDKIRRYLEFQPENKTQPQAKKMTVEYKADKVDSTKNTPLKQEENKIKNQTPAEGKLLQNIKTPRASYIKAFHDHDVDMIISCLERLHHDPFPDPKHPFTSLNLAIINELPEEIILPIIEKWKDRIEKRYKDLFGDETYYGYTAFLNAVVLGKIQIVEMLKEAGCDLSATTKDGRNALHLACLKNNYPMVEKLLSFGVDSEYRNNSDVTPFLVAASRGNQTILELMRDKNTDLNIDQAKKNGVTPFLISVIKGHDHLINILSDWGANIHQSNNFGENAAFLAVKFKQYSAIPKLKELGCDFYQNNRNNFNPITYAASQRDFQMIKLLNQQGFDVMQRDNKGRDIFHFLKGHKQHKKVSFSEQIRDDISKQDIISRI